MATKPYSTKHLALAIRVIKREAEAARREAYALWNDYNLGLVLLTKSQAVALGELTAYLGRSVHRVNEIKAAR